ncbi:hypothetical protein VB713_15940 [Anabaena cylindrica UHCC 0172]|uniref:hypothetical protein n=1 Tax=Anabaena cylindrica TaxID=1165 RepID=UPI002B1EC9AC|nr:hypothetical protein [Anabaena cylindrica]MEA5552434.1 hypothetical protein [Anabaena cylindrica UHCC 0172]
MKRLYKGFKFDSSGSMKPIMENNLGLPKNCIVDDGAENQPTLASDRSVLLLPGS